MNKKPSGIAVRLARTAEYEALKAEILSEFKKENDKSKKEKVTHDQQILILHYLGIGNELDTKVDKAKLYAPIMNRPEEGTRQKLSHIEKFKTKKNLHFLLNYFEGLGLRDKIGTIKKELD